MITSSSVWSILGALAILTGWAAPVRVSAQTASVTPDGGSLQVKANQTGQIATFTVYSGSSSSQTYTLEWTCYIPATNCNRAAGSSVTFTYTTTVDINFSTGSPGTGKVKLRATGPNGSDTGYFNVTVAIFGAAVTPDGAPVTTGPANTTGHSEAFTVQNTGTLSNTYSFACGATAPITCTGLSTTSATVAAGATTDVTAFYSVGANGTGSLSLTATGTYASDGGSYNVQVITQSGSFVPSSVTSGAFTQDGRYLVQEVANTYNSWGQITELADARGKITRYQYGGNPNNAFLTKVTRVKDASGTVDLVTDIAYDGSGFISSIKDEGGSFRYFTYDLYGRLRQVKNNATTVVRAYGYTYSRTSPNWTFNPASPNAVVDSTFLQQTPTVISVVGTQFIDGLGRPIQMVVKDGTNYHVAATQYDVVGRVWRSWKPYTRTTAGYDASFTTNATSFYTTYLGTTATPYIETQYRPDALDRVSKVIPEYLGTTPTIWTLTGYGVDAPTGRQITEVTDEAGKKTRGYNDAFGNAVRSILGFGAAESTTTNLTYNVLGQRTQATDPRGLNTTYTLDTRGLLSTRTSPDAGTVNSKYDKAGSPRFAQDANQVAAGQVSFVNYDFAGRPLTSGLGTATFAALDPDATAALETTQANWLVAHAYDAKPSTAAFPWSLFSTQITPLTLANVAGRLAAIVSKSGAAWQVTLFSYDADGQVATRYTYTQANSGASVLTAVNAAVGYTRDLRGALNQRSLTVGSSTFYQWYDYDNRGLFWKLYASTTSTKPATPDVTDTYRPSGQPQNFQFQGGPLEPITYTIRDQIAKVGDPALTTYPFSARYAYRLNGTVDTAEFYSAGSPAAQKRYRYAFGSAGYDALNRLKSADFSSWSGSTWTSTLAYDLAGINYDAAGNITALQRYRETGTLIDNLTYAYPTSSDRLSSVTDAIATTAEAWDAETGSFTYDANGNLKTAPAPYSVTAVTYDPANLPLSIARSGVTTAYRYDDANQRITKQVGTGNTEVYILEGASTLSVFTVNSSGTATSWYFNLLAAGHVEGRQPNTGSRSYYYTDHLGSTRAVVQGTTVVESYDFEPWGLLMPGRTLGSGTKEGFGGKEQDTETGLDYYGARYYMPALGRWTAVDPEVDGMPEWSPYNYVYDNPVLHTDPDGRQTPSMYRMQAALATFSQNPVVQAVVGTSNGVERFGEALFSPVLHPIETAHGLATLAFASQGDPMALLQMATGVGNAVEERRDRWNNEGIEGKFDVGTELALNVLTLLVPAGDVAEAADATRAAELGGDAARGAVKAVHGNSRLSTTLQHRYEIYETASGDVVKTGISGRPLNANGTSPRANLQVNAFNRAQGAGKYAARVAEPGIAGRQAALQAEKAATKALKDAGNSLRLQKRP
jgi:RHS repeat-associated protein